MISLGMTPGVDNIAVVGVTSFETASLLAAAAQIGVGYMVSAFSIFLSFKTPKIIFEMVSGCVISLNTQYKLGLQRCTDFKTIWFGTILALQWFDTIRYFNTYMILNLIAKRIETWPWRIAIGILLDESLSSFHYYYIQIYYIHLKFSKTCELKSSILWNSSYFHCVSIGISLKQKVSEWRCQKLGESNKESLLNLSCHQKQCKLELSA